MELRFQVRASGNLLTLPVLVLLGLIAIVVTLIVVNPFNSPTSGTQTSTNAVQTSGVRGTPSSALASSSVIPTPLPAGSGSGGTHHHHHHPDTDGA